MNYTPKPLLFEATSADPVATWLFGEARELPDSRSIVGGFCQRLVASDFGLYRLALSARTLHPQVVAIGYVWRRGDSEASENPREHGILEDPAYLQSPVKRVHDGAPEVRRRLEGPDAAVDFPILEELQAEGVTDYIALPVPLSYGRKNVIMVATDRPGGFHDGELARLRGLLPLLSLVLEVKETKRILRTLLDVYLGHDAGRRVLGGLIKRGDGITLAAALWYCDLRGFTAMAETLPRDATIALLNDYFECMVGPVQQHGGEVLKFIGDAMLAIFPIADDLDRDRACHAALAAAEAALADLAQLNDRRRAAGRATLEIGIALHMGAVTYGNIGGPERLDFTVVGPAVNLVTRLEGLCSELGRPLLASARFASPCGSKLVSLGRYRLRSFAEEHEVFTLPPPSPVVQPAMEVAAT